MKKLFLLLIAGIFLISCLSVLTSAVDSCRLDVTLLNQDPINAVPGDYVKVVFQLTGIGNPDCKTIYFSVAPEYPFSLDNGTNSTVVIQSGAYTPSYNSQATVPFTLRVDNDALDKNYSLKTNYRIGEFSAAAVENDFDIPVENVKSDFDIYVQDYDFTTHSITLDILNTGKNDVTALTSQIQNPDQVGIKGGSTAIIGSLDSSQDTTFNYEISPQPADLRFSISYTDENGVRRTTTKIVHFEPSYFEGRQADIKKTNPVWYVVVVIILVIIVVWYWRRRSRKKALHQQRMHERR